MAKTKLDRLRHENSRLRDALAVAKRTVETGGGGGVTCTVWVPEDVSPNETLCDFIDSTLQRRF